MVAAEPKAAAIPPEGGPPPGERLRLPAGEEAGRGSSCGESGADS